MTSEEHPNMTHPYDICMQCGDATPAREDGTIYPIECQKCKDRNAKERES